MRFGCTYVTKTSFRAFSEVIESGVKVRIAMKLRVNEELDLVIKLGKNGPRIS